MTISARNAAGLLARTGADALAGEYAKYSYAFPRDGVGDLRILDLPPAALITTDSVGNGPSPGSPTLTVGAAHTIGTIDTIGDRDYYQVTLIAGQTYEIGMYGYAAGPNLVPLADSYIELFGADGTSLIVSGDGGAMTPANTLNSGFDVLLTFEAQVSGTYFLNAQAFDNTPENGTGGEGVGDYELFVQIAPPGTYRPYYDVDSPLYAIDWGTRVNKINQSAANPDGNEGTRPTGNAQGTPVYGSALDIPALAAAQGVNVTGKNVITLYFAKAGDVFVSNDPTNPGLPPATITAVGVQEFEYNAVLTALAEFSKVADIVYLEVQDRDDADFIYTSYQGTPGPGVSLLGSMSPPDESDEGLAQFNSGDQRWNALNLQQGGFSYVTLIHEFGHGHALAHPHDNGGRSGIMRGVESDGVVADYTTGDFDLNQGVFTMMSYEDGWQTSPYGNAETDVGYGYLGGLMAFDIAAIQDKYGVNEEWATGNDTYSLKDVNAAGTFYSAIWDGGGTDQIVYTGMRDTTIDLRAATLQYEAGGGGFMSYASGIYGGFTVANGVTIENATTDKGKDTLFGNSANNVLSSGDAKDLIVIQDGGNDVVLAGAGDDYIYAGGAFTNDDGVNGGAGVDTLGLVGNYNLTFSATSLVDVEKLALYSSGNAAAPASYNITTNDANAGTGGLYVTAQSLTTAETLVFLGMAESSAGFIVQGGAASDTIVGGEGKDLLFGNAGADSLYGSGGDDVIAGGLGADLLYGGRGRDVMRYDGVAESSGAGIDHIQTFERVDRIDLSRIDANSSAGGDQAFSFIGSAAFTAAGQVRAAFDTGLGRWTVQADVNGDLIADLSIQVSTVASDPLIAGNFIL